MKRASTVAVAAALCLSVALPARAADATNAGAQAAGAPPVAAAQTYEEAIHLLDPYVVVTKDGTFALTATAAEAGVDQATYDTLADGMAEINGLLRMEGVPAGAVVATPGATGGIGILAQQNRIIIHWWGWEVWLDSTNSNKLAAVLTGGGGVAALLTGIFGGGPVTAGIVVAVSALSLAAVLWCNSSGRGIKIIKPIPVPVPYCTSQ